MPDLGREGVRHIQQSHATANAALEAVEREDLRTRSCGFTIRIDGRNHAIPFSLDLVLRVDGAFAGWVAATGTDLSTSPRRLI